MAFVAFHAGENTVPVCGKDVSVRLQRIFPSCTGSVPTKPWNDGSFSTKLVYIVLRIHLRGNKMQRWTRVFKSSIFKDALFSWFIIVKTFIIVFTSDSPKFLHFLMKRTNERFLFYFSTKLNVILFKMIEMSFQGDENQCSKF